MNNKILSIWNQAANCLKQHSPQLMVAGGCIGTVAGGIMACFATMKLGDILNAHREQVKSIREAKSEDEKKEVQKARLKTGIRIVALYGPSVAVEAASITGILAGHHILHKRNMALAAAYTMLDAGFKEYRGRVVDRYGEEADQELRNGTHKETVQETVQDENGKEQTVEKTVHVTDKAVPSDYARYFCYGEAQGAEQNDDYNMFFLQAQERVANQMFQAKGMLTLNDIYDMLGIKRSIAGQRVGWVYDKHDEGCGDNYIDFRIQEVYRKRSDAPGDYEHVLMIDPNVDGVIEEHAYRKGLITE